jgi:hypothetical protein
MADRDAIHATPVRRCRPKRVWCTVLIPQRLLVMGAAFGPELEGIDVCEAIARGVEAAGRPAPDACPVAVAHGAGEDRRTFLEALDFDTRMRRARAVVVAWEDLREHALAGSVPFEIATRARQGGVPCYAVTRRNQLEPFDARILDLQAIVEADSIRALASAGRRLARLAWPDR